MGVAGVAVLWACFLAPGASVPGTAGCFNGAALGFTRAEDGFSREGVVCAKDCSLLCSPTAGLSRCAPHVLPKADFAAEIVPSSKMRRRAFDSLPWILSLRLRGKGLAS